MTILEHLSEMLGGSGRLLTRGEHAELRAWSDVESPEILILCTVGMSDRPQKLAKGQSCPSKEPRIELMSYCHPAHTKVVGTLLLDLSAYAFRTGKCLFWWQTVPLGRTVEPNSKMEALLLTFPPYNAEDVTFVVDRKRRDLVLVTPISATELDFCRNQGIEEFEQLMEESDVDVADIFRDPIV